MSRISPRRAVPALAAVAALAVPSAASAATAAVPVKPGTTTAVKLDPALVKALKKLSVRISGLAGTTASFRVTGGSITSPAADAGTITHAGSVTLAVGRRRVSLANPLATIGTSSTGILTVSVRGHRIKALRISGGQVVRSGFDTGLSGVTVKLTATGASAVNRALKVRAFKSGTKLGTLTSTEKLGGFITKGGTTSLAFSATTVQKLTRGGIVPSAVAPATLTANPTPAIAFPVNPGTVISLGANGVPVGRITHGGGLTLRQPSSGKFLTTTAYTIDTTVSPPTLVVSTAPSVSSPFAYLAPSSQPVVNPATRTITLSGVQATLHPLAAVVLNATFANGQPAFSAGDLIGTGTVTIQAQ